MAFNGNLLYLYNNTTSQWDAFPNKYIYKESYKGALEVQDLDSTRNANGKLIRNVLDHTAFTIEFQTTPMWNNDMNALFKTFIGSHYINTKERKLKVKFYKNETDDYDTGEFYMSTPSFSIARIDGNKIFYNSVTINLIQY